MKLKNFQEQQEAKDKDNILKEIEKNQTRKKCIKIHKEINPIDNNYIKLEKLRAATWNGIPETIPQMRCESWKLLLDYTPIDKSQLKLTLERKRQEYFDIVEKYFGNFENSSVNNLVVEGQSKPVQTAS